MKGDPKFEISSAYPELNQYYGLLVGLFYSVPYALAGLYAGSLTKTGNRKLMMIGVVAALSMFQISTGLTSSFLALALFRFMHGAVSSATKPLAFSMVADYFPQDKRSTANSILSGANFIGIALSSMTIILIKNIGWRASYCVMGGLGLIGATLAALVIKNPIRGQFDRVLSAKEKMEAEAKKAAKKNKPKGFRDFLSQMSEINKNPVCKNIFIAGYLRTMGSMIVTAFVPVFFQKVFPAFKSQYALINAAALTIFGFSSSLIGGMLSDKYEKKSYMTKSRIIMAGHFMAVPLTAIACFSTNFWLSIACFAAKIFVSGSYYAPAITMMQNSTDPSDSGFVVSAYTFYAYLA
jgi:MFS family permease